MKSDQQNDKNTLSNKEHKKDTIFLNDSVLERCNKGGLLKNRYYIDKSQPILPLFNEFYEVYCVKDIQDSDDKTLYATIFKKPIILKIDKIQYTISNNIDNFVNPIAIGVVEIEFHNDQEEYIAIIYRRISGVSLGELIDKNEHFSDKYIIKNIVYNVNEVLRNLHKLNITHGSINLDNIYLTKDGKIVVGECFSFPCGYTQNPLYEHVSISRALPSAKSNKNFKIDYYALGVVCLELVLGKRIRKYTEELNAGKIYSGSYKYFLNNEILTGTINKIIQGLLQDKEQHRFGYEQLCNITSLKGVIFKSINNDFSEPIYFNNKKIYNFQVLAYEMSMNLKKARDLVYSGVLQAFLQKSDSHRKLLKQINIVLYDSIKACVDLDFYTKQDFTIAEVIRVLSSQDVFLVKGLSICFEKYAIGNLILHLVNNNEEGKLKLLSDIIRYQIAIHPEKFKDDDFFIFTIIL